MKLLTYGAALVATALVYHAVTAPAAHPASVTKAAVTVQAIPAPAPFRGVVFVDITDSRNVARITVSVDDFTPLLDRLRTAGGEIGFGLIREDSNRPLIRCYVPAPPEPPALPASGGGNVFMAANARKREESERKKYEAKRRAWEAEATARINAFVAATTPLVEAPAHAPATDVTNALVRADLMLAEPSPFARPADTAIVLITDGLHNATTTTVTTLRANTRVVVVNGVASLGVLAKLTPAPVQFESTTAAIRYVAEGGSANVR